MPRPKPKGYFVKEEEINKYTEQLSAICGRLTGAFFRDVMFVRDSRCRAKTYRLNSFIRTIHHLDDQKIPIDIPQLDRMVSEIVDCATHHHEAHCCYVVNRLLYSSIAVLDIDHIKSELSDEEIIKIITDNLDNVRWIIRSGKGIHVIFKYRKPFYIGEAKNNWTQKVVLNGRKRFELYENLAILGQETQKFSDITTFRLTGIFSSYDLYSINDLSSIKPRPHAFRFPGTYNPKHGVFSRIIYHDENAFIDPEDDYAVQSVFRYGIDIILRNFTKHLFSDNGKIQHFIPIPEPEKRPKSPFEEGKYDRINNFNPKTFFHLPFIRKIFQNGYRVPEGLRHHVGTTIAIACRLRNIPYEKAETIMEDYVNYHIQSGSHSYTISEAQATLRSVYRQNPPWEVSGKKMLSELGYHRHLPDISFSEIYSFVFNVSVSLHKRKTKPYSLTILEILKEYQKTKNPYPSSYDFLKSINKNSKTHIYQILKNVHLLSRSIDKQGKPYKVYLYKGLKSFYLRLYSTPNINSKYGNNILSRCDERMREEILKILKEIWKEYDERKITEYIDMLSERKVKKYQEQIEELMERAPPWEEVRTLSPDG